MKDSVLIARLEQANEALRKENSRLHLAAGKKPKFKASPRGQIDMKGKKAAAKVGVGCGFAGAWSDDIMTLVHDGAMGTGGWVKVLYNTTMVEDMVGWCIGFLVGTIAVGFYKFTKKFD